jgi:streptogramin lyase
MRGANKIGRISTDGKITTFDAGMGPVGIASGADGALWFTGYDTTAIGRLTTDGVLSKIDVPTYASIPYHIAAGPDGSLWFTEQEGNKIGQIRLPAVAATPQPSIQATAQPQTTFTSSQYKLPMTFRFGPDGRVIDDYADLVTLRLEQDDLELGFNIVTDARLADANAHLEVYDSPDEAVPQDECYGMEHRILAGEVATHPARQRQR